MKIYVRDLKPNPFRHFAKYPILRDKVNSLKNSISETDFWDNVLARESPGKEGVYEIAYGHHRLAALRELGIKEVDIPVRKLEDATMIRIMANENLDDWRSTPAVINETVAVAKEFIDSEMAKAETLESANKSISGLFVDTHAFNTCKAQGAGQTTILKFLGGNWKQWMIQESLSVIADKEVDREAVEEFDTQKQAETFRKAVKRVGVPKAKQKALAKKIKKEGRDSRREIDAAVEDSPDAELSAKMRKKAEPKMPPHISEYLDQCIERQLATNSVFKEILDNRDQIDAAKLKEFLMAVRRTIVIWNEKTKGDTKWQTAKFLPTLQ
jgi:ParB/RepB/Spo0J family partition protein